MRSKDWAHAATIPGRSGGSGETKWVVLEKFFDQLGTVLETVPPLPGEQTLHGQFRILLDAAKGSAIASALVEVALETERDVIAPFRVETQRTSSRQGWNRSANNARCGHDYYNRTGTREVEHVRQQAVRDSTLALLVGLFDVLMFMYR